MTIKLQVAGDPVAHSLSPTIHAMFAKQFGDEITYGRERVLAGHFHARADAFRDAGGLGMNVTVPHKEAAFAYVDAPDTYATAAGAVNTINFLEDGQRVGRNTDGWGLVADLTTRWGIDLADQSVLIIGAGGATRGVILPLFEAGVTKIMVANRTANRAENLCRDMRAQLPAAALLSAHSLETDLSSEDIGLIVNATSVGLSGAELRLPVCDELLAAAFCYDMGYGSNAGFYRQVGGLGCERADGLGMLVEQAALSYEIWLGHAPETGPVYEAVRNLLTEAS